MQQFEPSLSKESRMSHAFAAHSPRPVAWRIAIGVLALGAVAVGAAELRNDLSRSFITAAPGAAPAIPVLVATVERRDTTLWAAFSGRLEAIGRVDVRPRASGAIIAAHFRGGALVRQGDLLFTIDPAPYVAEVQRLDAQVAAAGARLQLAAKQQQRGFQLGSTNYLAKSDVDQRVNEYRAATANLRAAMASLETAKLNLGYTEVRAPISGRVGKIEVTAGNLVEVGQSAPILTTLVSVNPIYASFDADEASVARAVAGLPAGRDIADAISDVPVEMGTLATEGTPLRGHLQLIDNLVDINSGTLRVRAVFDNADGHLMPGQFARLRLGGAKPEPVIAIDERAIGTDQDRRFVMVVGANNKVAVRPVNLGAMADNLRIVTSGLNPGEHIVVDGLQRVRPGAVVAPQSVPMANTTAENTALASR